MSNDLSNETALRRHEVIAPLLVPGLDGAEKRRIRREILEREGISERTLRRYLAAYREDGYEGLKPRIRSDNGRLKAISREILERTAARRFAKSGRNVLWQADIKYGPYIPAANGGKKRTYLIALIDDATRYVCNAQFYDNQRLPILEDSFRKAVLKCGKPDAVYVDNGKIFVSRWFRIACAKLGIRHLNTKAYSPQSKGKIERFNATVEEFLQEISLEKPRDLNELNQKFRIWLDEGYNNRPHSSLKGDTPMHAYTKDPRKIRFATPEECRDAFLWEDTRKVDRTGCFRLNGIEYEAGLEYTGKKVDVRYDPFDMSLVEIWHGGERKKAVPPLKVGAFCGGAEKVQASAKATHSRLLKVYEAENAKRQKKKTGALSFRSMKGGGGNV